MKPLVEIVLATHNGEIYLEKQLNSIVEDTSLVNILIHDDGSADSTSEILSHWSESHLNVKILRSDVKGDAKANFSYLLSESKLPYISCADQDDIWLPDKTSKLLREMQFYESVYGKETPLLIHSDLKLIDEGDEEISPSFWKYQNLDPSWGDQFGLLLTQNVVTGCTMMANRALLKRALPIPDEAIMHDWWLALVACAFGKVVWIEEPTVLYRQHQKNEVGAKAFNAAYVIKKGLDFLDLRQHRSSQMRCADQAGAFAKRYPASPAAEIAGKFVYMEKASPLKRRKIINQEKFYKIGFFRNFAWMWLF